MCLDTVKKRLLFPDPTVLEAYKIFNLLETCAYSPIRHTKIPRGKWVQAKGFKDDHGWFRTGFYVYANISPSSVEQNYRTLVYVRNVVTVGKQYGELILIAREIYVPLNGEVPDGVQK